MNYSARLVGNWGLGATVVATVFSFYVPIWPIRPLVILGAVLVGGAFLISRKKIALKVLLMGLVFLGAAYGTLTGQSFERNTKALTAPRADIALEGSVAELISESGFGRRDFNLQTNEGLVEVQTRLGVPLVLGQQVAVSGKTAPLTNEYEGYGRYLIRQGVVQIVEATEIKIVESRSNLSWAEQLVKWRETLRQSLIRAVPGQAGDLVAGMAFGGATVRDQALLKAMNVTGTRHLVAISGFNIGIIGAGALGLFFFFGLSRRAATFAALVIIVFYVLLTGLSPSAVRAAVMGGLFFYALSRGFGSASIRLLGLAGGAMLLISPGILEDIGFQLSFVAVVGLIYLVPLIQGYLDRFLPKWLSASLAVVAAAQGAVAPLLWYHFGTVSVTAVIYNFLLIPLVPLATVLAIFVAGAGLLSAVAAQIFALPLNVVVNAMTGLIFLGSRFPAIIALPTGNWFLGAVIYAGLIWVVSGHRKKQLAFKQRKHKYAF